MTHSVYDDICQISPDTRRSLFPQNIILFEYEKARQLPLAHAHGRSPYSKSPRPE